jgi:hypothetical protein
VRKTIIDPDWWSGSDGPDGETAAAVSEQSERPGDGGSGALGQAIHRPDGLDVTLSGLRQPSSDGDHGTEVRETLSLVRRVICDDLGGELDDVTHVRAYVLSESLAAGRTALRRVCHQTFEWPAYPAMTAVGVAALADGAVLELEVEAFVPADGWEFDLIDR